jgi:gamma-glutamyl-gamma-aminobutyrate hydrolase PuuD
MKISITQRVIDFRNGPYDSLDHGFYDMLSGHELKPIPNNIHHFRSSDIINSDLVIFTGGNSMFMDNWQYNSDRLRIEKHVLDIARSYNKPILGISRGSIFLNISLGGTIEKTDRHTDDHIVYYKKIRVNVKSRHEELFTTIPPGASVIATDENGACESWKLDNIVTVLWHPERMEDHWMPLEVYDITGL